MDDRDQDVAFKWSRIDIYQLRAASSAATFCAGLSRQSLILALEVKPTQPTFLPDHILPCATPRRPVIRNSYRMLCNPQKRYSAAMKSSLITNFADGGVEPSLGLFDEMVCPRSASAI
jgi:hypothetical protein